MTKFAPDKSRPIDQIPPIDKFRPLGPQIVAARAFGVPWKRLENETGLRRTKLNELWRAEIEGPRADLQTALDRAIGEMGCNLWAVGRIELTIDGRLIAQLGIDADGTVYSMQNGPTETVKQP